MKHEEQCLEDTLADLAKTRDGEKDWEVAREEPVTGLSHCKEEKKSAWVFTNSTELEGTQGDDFKN